MFLSQVVATTFSCFIQIVVLNLSLNNIPNVCEQHQVDHFTCPGGRVFFAGESDSEAGRALYYILLTQ
jgi:hypothetical protein